MKKNCLMCSNSFEDTTKNSAAKFCSIRCRSAFKRPLYDKWKTDNREKFDAYQANYYETNKDVRIKQSIDRINANREKHRIWCRKRHAERSKTDILYKHTRNVRSRLNKLLNGKRKSGFGISAIGCSREELKIYLESKFKIGMTWENYGKWHIDHIKPLASFDLNKPEQLQQASHYTNLQPLWATENIKKGIK